MASPGQESESLNRQFLVASMLAMIHTAGPHDYYDYLDKRRLARLGVMSLCTTCPGGIVGLSFIARLKGLWPRGEPASRPEKTSDTKLASAVRMGEYRSKLHSKAPLRDRRA